MHSLVFNLKRNIIELSLVLFVGFCSAYITQITSYSPYYFGYLVSLLFLFLYAFINLKIGKPKNSKILLFFTTIIFLYYIFNGFITKTQKAILGNIILLCVNQISTIITYQICSQISFSKKERVLKDSINFFYKIALFLGICDFLYRFVHSTRTYVGYQFFYNFKLNSLMFPDSNWTGFIYMLVFAFFVYLKDNTRFITKKQIVCIFVVILLSFSRAATASSILVILYSEFQKLSKSKRKFVFIISVMLFFIFVPIIISFLSKDDSFGTKLALLNGAKYYLHHVSLKNFLFGNGTLAASTDMSLLGNIGYSAHLYLIIKILDLGLIGLLIDFGYLLIIFLISRKKFFYLVLPFFVCGLSMCPTNLSMMYVFGGLMIYIEENKRRNNNGFNFNNNACLQC